MPILCARELPERPLGLGSQGGSLMNLSRENGNMVCRDYTGTCIDERLLLELPLLAIRKSIGIFYCNLLFKICV